MDGWMRKNGVSFSVGKNYSNREAEERSYKNEEEKEEEEKEKEGERDNGRGRRVRIVTVRAFFYRVELSATVGGIYDSA